MVERPCCFDPLRISTRTPDFPIEFNQQNSIPHLPHYLFVLATGWDAVWRVRMNFAEGFPHTAPPSRLNLSLLLACFQQLSAPCSAENWHTKECLFCHSNSSPACAGETWGNLDPVGTRAGVPFERVQSKTLLQTEPLNRNNQMQSSAAHGSEPLRRCLFCQQQQ